MQKKKKFLHATLSSVLAMSLVSPSFVQAEQPSVAEEPNFKQWYASTSADSAEIVIPQVFQVEETVKNTVDFSAELEKVKDFVWTKRKTIKATSFSAEQILALWQADPSIRADLKEKSAFTIQGETASNYTTAVLKLGVSHSNPFGYEGVDYAAKLANSQTGEGYFYLGTTDEDKKASSFVPALFALEFVGAEYNRETALNYLLLMSKFTSSNYHLTK